MRSKDEKVQWKEEKVEGTEEKAKGKEGKMYQTNAEGRGTQEGATSLVFQNITE